MRKVCFILLTLTIGVGSTGMLSAQSQGELYCAVTYKGQNQKRTVSGAVNVECGAGVHSAPFGNWGVKSNYGGITDTDQFRGWKHEDGPPTKRQWNSCTTRVPKYRAPNCNYYNDNACTTQRWDDVVSHGTVTYRSRNQCPQYLDPNNPQPSGCSNMGRVEQTNNYMRVYELDLPDCYDYLRTLKFPRTSVTLTSCNYDGCPERTSSWVQMGSSEVEPRSRLHTLLCPGESHGAPSASIRAELRMKAKAQVVGYCDTGANSDWNWE